MKLSTVGIPNKKYVIIRFEHIPKKYQSCQHKSCTIPEKNKTFSPAIKLFFITFLLYLPSLVFSLVIYICARCFIAKVTSRHCPGYNSKLATLQYIYIE